MNRFFCGVLAIGLSLAAPLLAKEPPADFTPRVLSEAIAEGNLAFEA